MTYTYGVQLTICLTALLLASFGTWLWHAETVESYSSEVTSSFDPVATPGSLSLLSAPLSSVTLTGTGGPDVVVEDGALVSAGPVGDDVLAAHGTKREDVRVYTVREGDSLSLIAEMFGVTTNTILWANDLKRASDIQPGQVLVILPVAGVQHTVTKGDTLSSIAKEYDGDMKEILSYNNLTEDSDLTLGQTLIIPGGTVRSVQAKAASAKPVTIAGTVTSGGNGLINPVPGAIKTQGIHGHNGVDLAAAYGTPVRAAAAGEVVESKSSGWNGGYGQYVKIKHANGTYTVYGHLMRNDVGVGEWVAQGQVIGGMGSTGKSTGNHLHFEVLGGTNPF